MSLNQQHIVALVSIQDQSNWILCIAGFLSSSKQKRGKNAMLASFISTIGGGGIWLV